MEDEHSRLVDALPGLIWTALPDGRLDFLNRRWCEYTGLTAADGIERGWRVAVHPDDVPESLERWSRIAASGEPAELEVRLRRSDGEYRWFLVRVSPLTDGSGNVVKWCGISSDIDDRKRTERERSALQVNFRKTCDSIPGLVCMLGPTGEVEIANQEVQQFFGLTEDELRAWGTSDAVHPDDLPRVREAFIEAITTGTPYDIEHRCRRADGVYRWFQVRALPVRDGDGRITGWFVVLTDIEHRTQVEEALRASERNLNVIINTIPALAWSALPDGSAEFFNQHYLDYVGFTQEQAKGVGWTQAVHPDDLPGLVARCQRILASGTFGEAEARLRRFDGEYRWLLFRPGPLRDESGQIVKWYGINTDIDDRKHAEEELRRNEAFLAEGERLNSGGSFWWRLGTKEITFSEEARRIFELDRDTRVTLGLLASRVHPEDKAMLAEKVALSRKEILNHNFEYRLRAADGSTKYLRMNAYGTRDREGRLEYIGAIQDVTERRLSEEVLGKVQSELAHMTRVASLGALTASIAHEVNQPLSGIITNANTCLRMLSADPPNVDGARETARRTIRDGNRASDVIARLRALFAKKDVAAESFDLNEATREVMALSRSELQRARVILRSELAEDLPAVVGDRVQLQQVILNLALNAAAAMSGIDDRPKELTIKTEREAGHRICLRVRDAGVGLDPQTMERLFEAFYTTKASGMGLGLSVSRSIIEGHGGRLWAECNDGPGATFSFSIPAASSPGTYADMPASRPRHAALDIPRAARKS